MAEPTDAMDWREKAYEIEKAFAFSSPDPNMKAAMKAVVQAVAVSGAVVRVTLTGRGQTETIGLVKGLLEEKQILDLPKTVLLFNAKSHPMFELKNGSAIEFVTDDRARP